MATSHVVAGPGNEASWHRVEANEAERTTRFWRIRLRYWLNSFRGFAALDFRGGDLR
jgi:hypothetical protein